MPKNVSQHLHKGEKDVSTQNRTENIYLRYVEDLCVKTAATHTHTLTPRKVLCLGASHLRLSLFQERLQPLLGGPPLVVVADDEDDVVPAELAHHVEPDVGLVGVGWDGAEEGQVDALGVGGRSKVRGQRKGEREGRIYAQD